MYAQQGYRIIAMAYKSLNKKVTYAKVQRISREQIESDLNFLGFVILENRLKPDTIDIVTNLMTANIRTIMVTGDNILTALSVAHDCDMIPTGQSVVIVTAKQKQPHSNDYELIYHFDSTSGNNNQLSAPINNVNETMPNNTINLSATHLQHLHNDQLKTKPNGFIANERNTATENGTTDYMLMTNSNSIASLETVDTCTQTTQITQRDLEMGTDTKPHNQYDDSYDETNDFMAPELPNTNYRFAMTGKTWTVIRDNFPDQLPKFVTRGTVFARMSPENKQALILELQELGYYVAMCGDGANDCGALKAAHTGISLSEAESSVASPFTSKNPTIACVPNVIKEGRCALVTSVAIFKYMAAYSLVQFVSVLTLYSIDSNLTDIEYLFIDLFMISIFAFFFGKTEAYVGPLVKQTPLNSLISASPIASLVLHLTLAIAFQVIGWFYVQQQSWFVPFVYDENKEFEHKCYENYTIFVISCFQYIILAVVFSKGAPYRKSIFSNIGFICSLVINMVVTVALAIWPWDKFEYWLELMYPPDPQFRLTLVAFGVLNFILSLAIEYFVIDQLLFRRLRYRFHNIEKSRRKFLSIENHLRQTPTWPPISPMFGNDPASGGGGTASTPTSAIATVTNTSEEDHQSPKSFTEICVESDFATLNNCSSVLKGFFDHLDSESESESASDSGDESDSDYDTELVQTNGIKPPIATSETNIIDNSDKELNQHSPSLTNSQTSSSNDSSLFVPNKSHPTSTLASDTGKPFTNHIQSNHCDSLPHNNNTNSNNNNNNTQINQILATSNS